MVDVMDVAVLGIAIQCANCVRVTHCLVDSLAAVHHMDYVTAPVVPEMVVQRHAFFRIVRTVLTSEAHANRVEKCHPRIFRVIGIEIPTRRRHFPVNFVPNLTSFFRQRLQ